MHQNFARRVVIGLVALFWATMASAQDDLSTKERRALPSHEANQVVRRDLLSVLQPVKRISSGMLRQLRGVSLTTRAFGTEFDGLCRRDAVTLWYAPTERGQTTENDPVRPYSIETQALFHIVKLAHLEHTDSENRGNVSQESCVSADHDERADWFAAKDARTAVQGVLVLEAALGAIKVGTLKAEPCPEIFDAKKASCEAVILANADIATLGSIEPCSAAVGELCYIVDLDFSTKLTIKARVTGDEMMPHSVKSIAIEQYIIVT